jgi:hypothetical protein
MSNQRIQVAEDLFLQGYLQGRCLEYVKTVVTLVG